MKRSQRVLLPPSFAALLPAADRARLQVLQAGLAEHLEAAEDDVIEQTLDPLQGIADLAQWYLVISTEPLASSVTVDVDHCTFRLREAAEHGVRPARSGVAELQQEWLASSRWPCFPGDDEPPLLRGG